MTQRSILLVEDNSNIREAFALLLQESGYDVRSAATGADAIRSAGESLPDLILLDLGLPDMNGFEVVRTIKRHPQGGKVAIVALTGHALEADREACLAAGCNGYLTKPISSGQLLAALPTFLPA